MVTRRASGLTRRQVERVLRDHRIRRLTAEDVLTQLRAPALSTAPGVVDAVQSQLSLLLPQVRVISDQQKRCAHGVDALLQALETQEISEGQSGEHRDVTILRSLPAVGRRVAATMLAEASRPLADRDYHTLRRYGGSAPVTKSSGKNWVRPFVTMRYACNHRVRQALYHWSRVSLVADDASHAYYRQLRNRGQTHGRALRSVADRLLRILVAMLKNRTLYDPARVSSRQPVETPA